MNLWGVGNQPPLPPTMGLPMKQATKLREHELHPFTARTIHYTCRVPAGTTIQDLFTKAYWADVAPRMQVHALIEVISADGSLDCDLRVVAVDTNPTGQREISVKLLRNGYLPDPEGVVVEPLHIKFAGRDKWRLMRGDAVIESGIDTKELAEAKLRDLEAA